MIFIHCIRSLDDMHEAKTVAMDQVAKCFVNVHCIKIADFAIWLRRLCNKLAND